MESVLIVLDEYTQKMIDRISKKVGWTLSSSDAIDINVLLDLMGELEDLYDDTASEAEHWEEEYKNLEEDIRDNYRPIPVAEQVDMSDIEFH